ncbi:hypothetical protein [Aestuariirhabdus sp. LZHN29]|uniref:hypothetical protein n=1 Tax=Aestuariirhabdus sp. LZHN29 TaxID=3417462 RepID=UPI003CFA8D2B
MKRWLLLAVLLAVALLILPTAGWLYSVQRLSDEEPLVEIQFRQLAPQRYRATLTGHDRCQRSHYELLGDQWRIDAQFIKWKTFATLLGMDPRYRLERLSGRYQSIDEENSKTRQVHDISQPTAIDLVRISEFLGAYNWLLDAQYGSSTYQQIDPLRTYRVYRTQSGLITRSEPRELPRYQDGTLTIRINNSCTQQQSFWQKITTAGDRLLGSFLSGTP